MKVKIWHTVVAFIVVRFLYTLNQRFVFGWKAWFIIDDILNYANGVVILLFVVTVIATIIKTIRKKKET